MLLSSIPLPQPISRRDFLRTSGGIAFATGFPGINSLQIAALRKELLKQAIRDSSVPRWRRPDHI